MVYISYFEKIADELEEMIKDQEIKIKIKAIEDAREEMYMQNIWMASREHYIIKIMFIIMLNFTRDTQGMDTMLTGI